MVQEHDLSERRARRGNPPENPLLPEVEIFPMKEFCMNKPRFTGSQIIEALKRVQAGLPVPDVCPDLSISSATLEKD